MKSLRCMLGFHKMGQWRRKGYIYRCKCKRCKHEKIKMVSSSVIKAELEVKFVKGIAEFLIRETMRQQMLKQSFQSQPVIPDKKYRRIDWK